MPKSTKSKVQIIRGNCDWGAILYSACLVFNRNLAAYWLAFVGECESEKSAGTERMLVEIEELSTERERILQSDALRRKFRSEVSRKASESRRQYVMSKPIGDFVEGWKKYRNAQMGADLVGMLDNMASDDRHRVAMQSRAKYLEEYALAMKLKTEEEMDAEKPSPQQAHRLLVRISSLKKSVEARRTPLARSLMEDRDEMHSFLMSEMQSERLMGVCLNILKTYSGGDFFVRFSEYDREVTANYIFDAFNAFAHNYDFLCGCYEKDSDGRLRLKSREVLEQKFYNGYYLTIRGFVQKAYVHARREMLRISSLDACPGGDDERDGYERMAEACSEMQPSIDSLVDEGMIRYWQECRDFFFTRKSDMEEDFMRIAKSADSCRVPSRRDVAELLGGVISGLDRELSAGRTVRSKLRHIILDAMGGSRSVEEWNTHTKIVQGIIKKYLSLFFASERISDAREREEKIEEINHMSFWN